MSARSSQPPGTPPASGRPGPRAVRGRRWKMLAGAMLGLAALGVFLVPAWRTHKLAARVQAGLPALPDAKTVPAMLRERLTRAQLRAITPPTALDGVDELGRLYHASGYPREAEACWQLLRALQPREARWCYYLADLGRIASDYPGMAAWLVRTTELAPGYAPAWLHLADLQLKTGQLAEAEQGYQKRLALLPGDPYARLGLARIALQQGPRDRAVEQIARLVKDVPDFSPGHNLYAQMLAAGGDAAGAGRERWLGRETGRFREADDPQLDELTAWCFNYEQLCIRGTVDFQTKHGDWGKACFERAIHLRPEVPTAYELLGSLYLQRDDAAKARDVFEQGLQQAKGVKPTVMFYVHLSRVYRTLKQPGEAARIAREGLALAGEEYELYDALGMALGDLGQPEAAVGALRTAVARNPGDANSNYNLALALVAVRRLDEAIEALHRSLSLQPTFPSSLAMLAQIEIDSGRWRDAAQYLQPLFESHPEMPQARQLMAYWHLRAGMEAETKHDLAAAEQHYRDGLAALRDHAELQAHLGTLCLIQGRFADAIGPLEAYHRLQPDNAHGSLYLGQAYAATGRPDEARLVLMEGVQLAERARDPATAQFCREILQHLP